MIGPPGSGKTTFCNGVQQFLRAIGRKVILVNLDPANENIPYDCDLDVRELINLDEVMEEHSLGPNGALLYCMETLELNFEWLRDRLETFDPESYFVFDFPGQVELFTNHESVYNLIKALEKQLNFRLVAVHLADSSHCKDASRFISLAMLTLQSMMRLECPQINIMSKFDKFETCDISIDSSDTRSQSLPLSFYADCQDLGLFVDRAVRINPKLLNLTRAISELINDFGLVSFIPVAIEDKECMAFLMQEIDKANGFVFGGLTAGNESILGSAMTTTNREEYLESMEKKYMYTC